MNVYVIQSIPCCEMEWGASLQIGFALQVMGIAKEMILQNRGFVVRGVEWEEIKKEWSSIFLAFFPLET